MLKRWGACGEENAWWWIGTRVRGDRHGTAGGVGHGRGVPHVIQRGRGMTTTAETLDRHRRDRDRRMVIRVADERRRAKPISRLTSGRMPVGALSLMMSVSVVGLGVGPSLLRLGCGVKLECSVVGTVPVDVCERRRSGGRHQHHNERHMRDELEHDYYSACSATVSG